MDTFRAYRDAFIRALGRGPLDDKTIDWVARAEFGRRWGGVSPQSAWRPRRDRFYVVNTALSPSSPGVHWVGVYVSPRGIVHVYDSFGRNVRRLLWRVGKTASRWGAGPLNGTDPDAEQRGNSAICGHASLAWLIIVRDLGIRVGSTI
jgi:hypothetical protein